MKNTLKVNHTTKQARVLTALVLSGILSFGNELSLTKSATAAPTNLGVETPNYVLKENGKSDRLPVSVVSGIRQDLLNRQIPLKGQLKVVRYSQETWRNGCLGLPRPNELCTQALVPGWRVTVTDSSQRWVYHTNQNGSFVRLAKSETPVNNLPQSVTNAVLEAASRRLGVSARQLTIYEADERTWSNGCLDLAKPTENCIQALVSGWRVIVGAPTQKLVYHTNLTGSSLRFNERESEIKDGNYSETRLPERVSNAVLQAASQFTGMRTSQLRIVDYDQITTDGCLSLPRPNEACTRIALRAWKVTVAADKQRLVFHAHPNGQQVRLNERASAIAPNNTIQPVPIRRSELPPPLDRGMLFRQITSGGITGRTYETVLMDNGLLIRVRIGDANDSERSVRRIPLEQVRMFQQLLNRQGDEFNNVSYPARRGAADYITYTLTSRNGTVQYNDMSQNNLPEDLGLVVNTWNRISRV
ncbi:MAG: hypothetical protein SAK29_40710 [Scytonema sp. PMC 1069.18]|nr:hypothetical protein [Scytonema sp. PMC 1069.18]MEC4886115.1 hypothetical protein [Scytonema sp. PMC 1070.18]